MPKVVKHQRINECLVQEEKALNYPAANEAKTGTRFTRVYHPYKGYSKDFIATHTITKKDAYDLSWNRDFCLLCNKDKENKFMEQMVIETHEFLTNEICREMDGTTTCLFHVESASQGVGLYSCGVYSSIYKLFDLKRMRAGIDYTFCTSIIASPAESWTWHSRLRIRPPFRYISSLQDEVEMTADDIEFVQPKHLYADQEHLVQTKAMEKLESTRHTLLRHIIHKTSEDTAKDFLRFGLGIVRFETFNYHNETHMHYEETRRNNGEEWSNFGYWNNTGRAKYLAFVRVCYDCMANSFSWLKSDEIVVKPVFKQAFNDLDIITQ